MVPVFEALSELIQSFNDDEPKPPLHVGEVMNCWTYLTVLNETISLEQSFLNMTICEDLKDFLRKVQEGAISQQKRLSDFLLKEGVPLPSTSETKPVSEASAVPHGVKFTDEEISNGISAKLALSTTGCATTSAESVRNDVGLMFLKFQAEAMTYGLMIKTLMKKKGWIKIPPYYYPPGAGKISADRR